MSLSANHIRLPGSEPWLVERVHSVFWVTMKNKLRRDILRPELIRPNLRVSSSRDEYEYEHVKRNTVEARQPITVSDQDAIGRPPVGDPAFKH